ncbi:aspartic peptidase domain-containing protein [Lipomyces oligophaga]|uniref:aspartic peptidase domain-containing protein n=1 Tax=Lipomyces oligophaga TaxID=45792 RepID=UPI0034CEBFA5
MFTRSFVSFALVLVFLVAAANAAIPYFGDETEGAGVVAKMEVMRRGGRVYDPDTVVNLKRFNTMLKSCLARYSRTRRELTGNRVYRKAIPTVDRLAPIGQNGTYVGYLEVGNPPQHIEFDLDMTSSDMWLESTTSVRGTRFDFEQSQTYFTDSRIVFRDCVESTDSLKFSGGTSFEFPIAHCTPHRATVRTLNPSGGMIGLAHSSLSQTNLPNFFEEAAKEGRLAKSMVTVEFFKGDVNAGAVVGFGGAAHQVDECLYAPVKTFGFWQILFKTLLVDGNGVIDNFQAVIDVTSPFVLAPPEDVRKFYSGISGAQPLADGFWSYPCFVNPKIHVEHGGWLFPFLDNSLGKVKESSGYCVGPVVEADISGLWVIGEPFLRGVLSVFDFDEKRVGFRTLG